MKQWHLQQLEYLDDQEDAKALEMSWVKQVVIILED